MTIPVNPEQPKALQIKMSQEQQIAQMQQKQGKQPQQPLDTSLFMQQQKIAQMQWKPPQPSQGQSLFIKTIATSMFNGIGKEEFTEGLAYHQSYNSVFKSMNDVGADIMFDYFDTNQDGTISLEEAQEIGKLSKDGEYDDGSIITEQDIIALKEKIVTDLEEQAKYEAEAAQIAADTAAAQKAYTQNIGGDNYRDYGSRTHNGSTISTPEQYTNKQELADIESRQIPELEQKKGQIIQEARNQIAEKNAEIEKITQEHKEKLGELGKKNTDLQKEIQDCDEKILQIDKDISDTKSSIHISESIIANLEAEHAALRTDTDDPKINEANTKRKAEIEQIIKDEKKKIEDANKKLEELEKSKQEQVELKAKKEAEQKAVQEEIDKKEPQLGQQIRAIKAEIQKIKEDRDSKVAEIDTQISSLRSQAIQYQSKIGTQTGMAASSSEYETAMNALKLAQGELAAGVREATGNNDGAAVAKYRNGVDNHAAWCASFASWCFGKGQNSDNGGLFGYSPRVAEIQSRMASRGRYFAKGQGTPQPGYIIFFQNGCSHVGIVESVGADGSITTIEGNAGNAVKRVTYKPGTSRYNRISGFGKTY